MIGARIEQAVRNVITGYANSLLEKLVTKSGAYAIKFVQSKWADHYSSVNPLRISDTPALTWGTATYVTPLAYPLSSALYGRIGLVTDFDPINWRIFDATRPSAQSVYVQWARSQPMYADLLLTVHSTDANHFLRNQFRQLFKIDCVLFHPDQEAEEYTKSVDHVWMAVTDWAPSGAIQSGFSQRLSKARFTVLIDEDFQLEDHGLPIRTAPRQIERITERMQRNAPTHPVQVSHARNDPRMPLLISQVYHGNGYLHVFIEP